MSEVPYTGELFASQNISMSPAMTDGVVGSMTCGKWSISLSLAPKLFALQNISMFAEYLYVSLRNRCWRWQYDVRHVVRPGDNQGVNIYGFFSQLPCNYHLSEVAYVGD